MNSPIKPINLENLEIGIFYNILHRRDSTKDQSGEFIRYNQKLQPIFSVGNQEVSFNPREYLFFAESSARKILKQFGIKLFQFNTQKNRRNRVNKILQGSKRRKTRKL